MKDRDLDAEFERIVAGWDAEAPDPQSADPDVPEATSEPVAPAPSDQPTPPVPGRFKEAGLNLPIAPDTGHVWRGSEPPAEDIDDLLADGQSDDEGHFEPPMVTDLPTAEEDPMYWAIVGGLAGGTLLLLYVLFFDRGGSPWWPVTAVAMIVVGFVLLVLRGGTERNPFDDGTRL